MGFLKNCWAFVKANPVLVGGIAGTVAGGVCTAIGVKKFIDTKNATPAIETVAEAVETVAEAATETVSE